MGNLISGIQHFFVTTFTTIATVVIVALPFHKPPIHPTPSPKQEVQIKKETTPSITPSPTQPASKPTTAPMTVSSRTSALIDCIGPDGKTIKLTQKKCDDFNTAWNKPPTSQGQNTTTNNTNGHVNTSGNTNYNNGSNYPNYVFPTYPPTNTGGSQQNTSQTNIAPVDHSLELQTCLSNAQNNYNSQMDDLNRRGMTSSGQADQVKSQYAVQQQSCHQQYGN